MEGLLSGRRRWWKESRYVPAIAGPHTVGESTAPHTLAYLEVADLQLPRQFVLTGPA
jgi:hypothetical protein